MKIKFERPTIYFSHPIRGTNNDFDGNCKKALAGARRLRRVFPEVDFYVPAEHDLALQILWKEKTLTTRDILNVDLKILSACHGWMFYKFDESEGSMEEWEKAEARNLTIGNEDVHIHDIEKLSYRQIRTQYSDLIERTVNRFREQS